MYDASESKPTDWTSGCLIELIATIDRIMAAV